MAFAGANCLCEADQWALIECQATRLAMVLSGRDVGGPLPRQGQAGSGDVLVRTIRPARIAENFDVFDFELTDRELAAIDALDTGVRGGPDPASVTLENYGQEIPEA